MSASARASAADLPAEVDLLVAGGGAGGLTAALVGALSGLRVLLCEATQQVGGTSATSAGTVWVPGNTPGRRAGLGDSVEAGAVYLHHLLGEDDAPEVRAAFLARAPEAFDFLQQEGGIAFAPAAMHPDYLELPGAATGGRAMAPLPFDGRLLGAEFVRVRPPLRSFMVFGSMMVGKDDVQRLLRRYASLPDFLHAARLLARWARDRLRHPRGTRLVMGNALVARLLHAGIAQGVRYAYGARLQSLAWRDGRVCGVTLATAAGVVDVQVSRGVVLATGGLGARGAWRERLMGELAPVRSLVFEANRGDGIQAAAAMGAQVATPQRGRSAFWQPVSEMPGRPGRERLFPHLAMDRGKPGLIAVLPDGRRFVNEGASYHHFVEAMLAADPTGRTPAWLICEQAFVRRYGLGAIRPAERLGRHLRSGYLRRAPDLAALARQIGIDGKALRETLATYNRHAAQGRDPVMGKGSTVLSRFNGDAAHAPNPCLAPIARGPFCAMAVWAADAASAAGLRTDEHARVLDAHGLPIAGLYACGNDMASIMGGVYPGPGITLGPALAFAYLAARHAAGKEAAAAAASVNRP